MRWRVRAIEFAADTRPTDPSTGIDLASYTQYLLGSQRSLSIDEVRAATANQLQLLW